MEPGPRETLVQLLRKLLDETLPFFELPEKHLRRFAAPGEPTLGEFLVFLSDWEAVYLQQLRQLAAEERPLLFAPDPAAWTAKLDYPRRDVKLAKQQFEAARRGVLELAERTEPGIDSKEGVLRGEGPRKFGQILSQVAVKNAAALKQVREILSAP
ncbi:MAG: hypothetical protein L6R28_08390 [Planctomycetes bacterium]|nr:hypothetical protein [Planctomycetota bacterium]